MKQLYLIEKPALDAWNDAWAALKTLHPEREKFKDKPHGGIQWKGTSVCMDVQCACGHEEHIDAEFFYSWVCPECETIHWVGDIVPLLPIPKEIAIGLNRSAEPVPEYHEEAAHVDADALPPKLQVSAQDIKDAGIVTLESKIENPGPLNRAEYDYLVKWLGRLTDDDAAHAFPILRQMRDSYHD